MKNKIVFSFCASVAALQLYSFFALQFSVVPFLLVLVLYGLFFIPRDFIYIKLVKIISYISLFLAISLTGQYFLPVPYNINFSPQIIILYALMVLAIYAIHKMSLKTFESYPRAVNVFYVLFTVLFFGIGFVNVNDYKLSSFSNGYSYLSPATYYQSDQKNLDWVVQNIKKVDRSLYFSATIPTNEYFNEYFKPFLTECGVLISPTKKDYCYNRSYPSIAWAINNDRYKNIKQAIQSDDTSGLVIPSCEVLPDMDEGFGKDMCYRGNARRIEHCSYIKEHGQRSICYDSLARRNKDKNICYLLKNLDPVNGAYNQKSCIEAVDKGLEPLDE